jgi:DNA repair exonuclease SbcCD ATPase subunit
MESMTKVLGLVLLSSVAAIFTDDPTDIKGLVSTSVTICGDDYIWSDIASASGVNGIKGINWKDIEDTMDDFLGDQDTFLEQIDTKIQNLKEEIARKKGEAASRTITEEEITELVKKAVEHETSFKSKDVAVKTACGKPGMMMLDGNRPNPQGFENGVMVMESIAGEFFDGRISQKDYVESEMKKFTRVCEDSLEFQRTGDDKADDLASYCDEMCAELARTVQDVSNMKSPTRKTDVRKLERELQRAETQKAERFAKKKECADAKTRIFEFRDYLKALAADMAKKHVLFQKAEWALADAQKALLSLTQDLEKQSELVDKANKGLSDLGVKAADAKQNMDEATALLADAKYSLDTETDDLNALMADMEDVRAAEKFADEVKEKLSTMLMQMDGFAEECVREPVRNIGLSEETKVYEGEFFVEQVSNSGATQDVKAALGAFYNYCENTAKNIFELVKDKIDLSPLCDLQDEDATMQEITQAVQERKDAVVHSIETVQSWLDPFKGSEVTHQTEIPEYVEEGEPFGLRRVASLLNTGGSESFYSTYLKKWKKKGEFLELLKKITTAINGLNDKIQTAQDELNKRTAEVTKAQDGLAEATGACMEAAKNWDLEKEDLTNVMQELETSVVNAKQNLEDLKRKREEARLAWIETRDALVKMHKEATTSLGETHAGLY